MLREAKDTTVQARLAVDAANRTTDVTREIGEASGRASLRVVNFIRPWVIYLEGDERDLSPNTLKIEVGHFGKSSAYNVVILAFCSWEDSSGSQKICCPVNHQFFAEIDGTKRAEITFYFSDVERMKNAGFEVPTVFYFEVQIFYEDIFTIGTTRDVNITTQRFSGADNSENFASAGDLNIGKTNRQKYEFARIAPASP